MATSNANPNNNLGHSSKASLSFSSKKIMEQSSKLESDQLQQMINCTLKKNPKTELSKSDLIQLLGYLEGELQARDVVIATLKADRVKQLVSHARYGRLLPVNDPFVALQRDSRAATMGSTSTDDTALLKAVTDGPMAALDALVSQHRKSHMKLIQAMHEAEARHNKVVRELEEEKRKHEHDTAQGDDITYGLEKERTRLREELEIERQGKKKAEKDLKKMQETLEEERQRQKQIVLLLLAERKKLILKYVEERKKSEDLAQILSEEKGRVDSMAEGLEEESQKALQMEVELEKHLAIFDGERAQLKAQLLREEKRSKELEIIIEKLQVEVENLKKQQAEAHQVAMFQAGLNQPHSPPRMVVNRPVAPVLPGTITSCAAPTLASPSVNVDNISPPQLPIKPSLVPPQTPPRTTQSTGGSSSPISTPRVSPCSTAIPLTSVTGHVVLGTTGKVVQPTATVTSMPVPAPTTGIARAVSPAGGIRNIQYSLGGSAATPPTNAPPPGPTRTVPPPPIPVTVVGNPDNQDSAMSGRVQNVGVSQQQSPAVQAVSPRVAVSASPGTKVFTTTNKEGKVTFHVTTSATLPASPPPAATSLTQPATPRKTPPVARGAPPPVPPNKPVVPPKKTSATTAPGQTLTPHPVVISSSTPQVATVDHGQPISLEVKPHKMGPQAVKFGITISRDKIQISSNPSQGSSTNPCDEVRDVAMQVGAVVSHPIPPRYEHAACHSSSSLLSLPLLELDVLDKELADFQQLLCSMASPSSPGSTCTFLHRRTDRCFHPSAPIWEYRFEMRIFQFVYGTYVIGLVQ